MRIGLYARQVNEVDYPVVERLINLLQSRNITILLFTDLYEQLKDQITISQPFSIFESRHDLHKKLDYLFSIGGDGTLLNSLTVITDSKIPVLGINIGRLGFLAQVGRKEIESALDKLQAKDYVLEKRIVLHLDSNKPLFGEQNFALNEFAIHKKEGASLIIIHTYVNDVFLNSFWADGLIVATPTGSTAYSLSCGGPIVYPESGAFIITPVAPHNLNVRPIIIPDTSKVSFKVEGRSEEYICTLDSRFATIDDSHSLVVSKEDFCLNLIRFESNNFFNTIRTKLMWGQDSRNY